MSDHVLLNLLNNLGKSDKMRVNEFNNTGERMLDFIHHRTLK